MILYARMPRRKLRPGDVFGEVAFFTEVAQLEAVHTVSTCRILVVPRDRYQAVASAFPLSARAVLTSLKEGCEQVSWHSALCYTQCLRWACGWSGYCCGLEAAA